MLHKFFLSEQRVGKIDFSSDLFFLVMVRHILFSNIYIKNLTLRTLLNEVVTVERINEKFTIEVKIQQQQYSERTSLTANWCKTR